ncbi:BnaC05g08100D [Brassica napus]|uniref:BnaC05g08100D protein n=1 Tax=Brassica napus TaxID=3708 RepID=A0A078HKV7_BRANA|nr:Unknown [Brassica napus]CAA8392067.1 Unknown [Brassica napus]CAA8403709.1 Unknown [Brassica napus]CDY37964.1 BnaC05g08100D [Brassica napus]
MMRGGERVKEFLRPFVDSREWDFCVIWKLGDDPSRFIEWVGCCCSGSYIDKNIKHEHVEEETQNTSSICRDEDNKHHIRTLACEALSRFPLFMPLYPGIHGEVVMSKSPKWLVNSGPGSKQDIFSTRVLVPVRDGLVELFSFIMKPVDESMVDLIISHCNTFVEPYPEKTLPFRIISKAEESMLMHKEEDVVMQNTIDDKKVAKENFKSKNLHSERKRRERINQRIYALRAVVPNVTKVLPENSFQMNKNGTLSDAVDYINQLLVEKQKLEDELRGINEIESRRIAAEEESAIANPQAEKVASRLNKIVNSEVNLEVHETGERGFLIRIAQEHKQDGFIRLIETVDSCGLEIIDVNFTRLDLRVMTVLNVKATKDGTTPENLRDLLIKMMMRTSENPNAESLRQCA